MNPEAVIESPPFEEHCIRRVKSGLRCDFFREVRMKPQNGVVKDDYFSSRKLTDPVSRL